jgi:hypothetical protein
MSGPAIGKRIKQHALKILESTPDGLRFSQLRSKIKEADSSFNLNAINGNIWNLDATFPGEVYKPARGIFRLTKYKTPETEIYKTDQCVPAPESKTREEDFYEPFADWLTNEIEDVTLAISLGRNKFKDKWGTPDVIGKREAGRRDIVKGDTEIVSAEIKTETSQLVTAFGQACAYKLFSHKAYLVVPVGSQKEEMDRLDSLCQIFGIGLVTFNGEDPSAPDFRILVRPRRHEPDLFWTNKYMAIIEKELFR